MCTYVHTGGVAVRVNNSRDLGSYLRERRHSSGFTQGQLAERAGVSRRWLSELEAGKASAEVGRVLRVVAALGLYADLKPAPEPEIDLDAYLETFEEPR
jgi:HTH-type transcriptional regulator/antitoxin HipB